MNLKVKYAKLQVEYFSNGTGNLGNVLDPVSRHQGMTLTWTPEGLFCSHKGVHFAIPLANVAGVTFFSDPFAEASPKVSQIAPQATEEQAAEAPKKAAIIVKAG